MVRRSLALLLVGACLFGVVSIAAMSTASGVATGGQSLAQTTQPQSTAPAANDGSDVPEQDDDGVAESRTMGSGESYGLLPGWEEAYDGKCVDCHAPGHDQSEPIHPTDVNDPSAAKSWFYDDTQQTGPNRSMENAQNSWITLDGEDLNCSDCHGVTTMESFGSGKTNRTANPHAVHEDYSNIQGCSRCHGKRASAVTFGVVSPIEMTSFRDEKLLSSVAEAKYGGKNLEGGVGWTEYGQAESAHTVARSCGDCHGRLHGARMGFAFDSVSRAGPLSDSQSTKGLSYEGVSLQCEACHPSDVHAVHTDATIADNVTVTELESGERLESAGAETCLECHGSGIVEQYGPHGRKKTARMLGLIGPRDAAPNSTIGGMPGGDCGFCHR